jgi:hypothetical protein
MGTKKKNLSGGQSWFQALDSIKRHQNNDSFDNHFHTQQPYAFYKYILL